MSDWMSEATRRIALGTPTPNVIACGCSGTPATASF